MMHISNSVADTESIAAELAGGLRGGECIALHGELGAGKTQFARGILRGLGGAERSVSSPTYVLLNVYETGRLRLFHLDAYRVAGEADFEAIGFAELLEQDGVVIVEWPERIQSLLPRNAIHIHITAPNEQQRQIVISPSGIGGSIRPQ